MVRFGITARHAVVAACLGVIAVTAGALVASSQEDASLASALAEGRTDSGLVETASRIVAEAQASGMPQQLALSLDQLGRLYLARGDYALAEEAEGRAATILREIGDQPRLASVLEQLVDAQIRRRVDLVGARSTLKALQAVRQSIAAADPVASVRMLEFEASIENRDGAYQKARELIDRAYAIGGDALPDTRAASLALLSGDVAYLTGDIGRAFVEWNKGLEAARLAWGVGHPALVPYMARVAVAQFAAGEVQAAFDLRLKAHEIAQRLLPPCHTDAIGTFNDLATSDAFFGDFVGARSRLETALATALRCFGPQHPSTAQQFGNLGLIVMELGDLTRAEQLQRQSLAARVAVRGPNHPIVALAREQLAEVLTRLGRIAEAVNEYDVALKIRASQLSADHPTIAQLLVARARALQRAGRYSDALKDLERASAIHHRQQSLDEPTIASIADATVERGRVYRALGRLDQAREAYAQVIAWREQMYGPSHPRVAEAMTLLARTDAERGDTQGALREAVEADAISREHLRYSIRYLTERQALDYALTKLSALDVILSAGTVGDSGTTRTAFDSVIRSRSVVLDELVARSQMGHEDSAIAPDVLQRFVLARQRYANLTVQSLREQVPRSRLDAARSEAEEAEAVVAQRSAKVRAQRDMANAGLDQIRAGLGDRTALVSFVRYERSATRGRRAAPVYGAFVLVAGQQTPTFVALGTAARIDTLVRAWQADVRRPGSVTAAGVALRAAVWDPLVAHIDSANRVFIVPDGALSLVSFPALPRRGGGYLVEDERVLHVLSTERDLVDNSDKEQSASALIVGGPAFAGNQPATLTATRAGIDCRGARPLAFPELPGARVEAQEVGSLWSNTGSRDAVILRGADATETAVKEKLRGRRVIHLATHGFFLGSQCDDREPGTRAIGGVVAASAPKIVRNPLSLSGLAFAGANRKTPGAVDDGILTAQEIASLDLHGTEWAVLSACNTGLGEIRSGEGVLGLRRAFQIAGARTVIMSLWSVDDQATRRWMQALYEARLTRGLDTAESVRAASLAILKQRRAARLSTHPFYWAAFVAAGDWR